jgi:integrase
VLRKPFAHIKALMGLGIRFTPRGLRRTFNDLARMAGVESLITRSISGHATDRMREHYSTVTPVEQRESIGRVLHLVKSAPDDPDSARRGAPSGAPASVGGAPQEKATG